jgi:hypothetical protein
MEPVWVEKGLAFIEAYDLVDLVGLQATLKDLGLEDHLVFAESWKGSLGHQGSR